MKFQSFAEFFFSLKKLLILGSFIHILATTVIYLIGRFSIFPGWILIRGEMREDAMRFLTRCEELSWAMAGGNLEFLYTYAEQIHIRFYAVAHFLFSGMFGSNILVFEFINLPLFLLILLLTYKIGEDLFEPKVGFIAAYGLMFFPSLVLHTTQPLRDTLFIAVFLFLFWQLTRLLKTSLSLKQSLYWTVTGSFTFIFLWFVRDSMWLVYVGIIFLGLFLVGYLNLKNKFKYKFNLLPVLGLLVAVILTPAFLSDYIPLKRDEDPGKRMVEEKCLKNCEAPFYLRKINGIRNKFSEAYEEAGSNIDAGYQFDDTFALIKYVPRAISIGLLAPFPKTWIEEGIEYGKSGRMLSGIETTIMYLFILLALITIVRNKRVDLVFAGFTVLGSVTALGLVMINVGAIYRLRYALWIIVIILGTNGLLEILRVLKRDVSDKG